MTGITPACAGKSDGRQERDQPDEDHPRVCGEKLRPSHPSAQRPGSPPRVRGKEAGDERRDGGAGITPACAGKSYLLAFMAQGRWDHPRVCGEKVVPIKSLTVVLGSPPRVRGKEFGSMLYCSPSGITPACAGKRICKPHGTLRDVDHPRVCGEKIPLEIQLNGAAGSPPRVRGKEKGWLINLV